MGSNNQKRSWTTALEDPHTELLTIADGLDATATRFNSLSIQSTITKLEDAVRQIRKAWCGSALGYHANVYYLNLDAPPAGANFSPEWGLKSMLSSMGSVGDWREFESEVVRDAIFELAGEIDTDESDKFSVEAAAQLKSDRLDVVSILSAELEVAEDSFLRSLKDQVEQIEPLSKGEVTDRLVPRGQGWSRDSLAVSQGTKVPPHIAVHAEVRTAWHVGESVQALGQLARKAGSHLSRKKRVAKRSATIGTNVFIGHGKSLIWRELKDFVEDRLNLPADEFNRVPVAGVTNIARLSEMLEDASIALLIMTGEDEQTDGKRRARMNVVHEAGLFQGKLGFSRAIVMLEDGCEEFSNIEGLGQIRFPKGNIKAAFEEVRQVLEREQLIVAE